MTEQQSRLTGASAPVILRHKGKELQLQFSPLSDVDISELDEWVRSRILRAVRQSFTPNMSSADKELELSVAINRAATATAFQGIGARMLASIDGLCRLVWQQAKKKHPELTEAELRPYLFDEENISEVNFQFNRMNAPAKNRLANADGKAADKKGKPRKKVLARRRKK